MPETKLRRVLYQTVLYSCVDGSNSKILITLHAKKLPSKWALSLWALSPQRFKSPFCAEAEKKSLADNCHGQKLKAKLK